MSQRAAIPEIDLSQVSQKPRVLTEGCKQSATYLVLFIAALLF